jgi:EmrB/QacA subfamily drug resistance transporter
MDGRGQRVGAPKRRQIAPVQVVDGQEERPVRRDVRGQPVEAVQGRQRRVGVRLLGQPGGIEEGLRQAGGPAEKRRSLVRRQRGEEGLEESPHDAEGERALELGAPRAEHLHPGLLAKGLGPPHEGGLADAGRPFDGPEPAAVRCGADARLEAGQLAVALEKLALHQIRLPGPVPHDGAPGAYSARRAPKPCGSVWGAATTRPRLHAAHHGCASIRGREALAMSAESYPAAAPASPRSRPASLSTRHGVAILLLLSLVQFMDVLDASILNIALPSIKRDLDFSQQSLQWVVSGYILTYGGFLLLGGRMADLLGRRRILVTGLLVFAGSSLAGGLAHSGSLLVGARFAQGLGAAMLSPAALSTLTTTFRTDRDRRTALGVWGAVSGLGGAAGVLFGGLLTEGPGWRWVLFVNVPFSAVALVGALTLLAKERGTARLRNFDALGAVLVTGGMLLLVYALVKAPDVGWSATRTVVLLAIAGLTLVAFVVNELRVANPLVPLSILKVRGVAAADATQMVALAGFLPMFFFLTLYMQTILGYSPIETGAAYLPLTGAVIVAAGLSSQLFGRIGTKPVIVAGSLLGAVGLYWLSRISVGGSYVSDILPGVLMTGFGVGAVFVGATTAANAGVGEDRAGLAAGLLNTAQQIGAVLGLAILSALATSRTGDLLHAGHAAAQAATGGYQRALVAGAGLVLAAGVLAFLTRSSRQTSPTGSPEAVPEPSPG